MIVFFDGVCGLCNRTVKFLLKRDSSKTLQFASLQSDFSKDLLARYGFSASDLDTVYLLKKHGEVDEKLYRKSGAVIRALMGLGGVWRACSILLLVPAVLRDFGYNFIAKRRYKMFGKSDACAMPPADFAERFLE